MLTLFTTHPPVACKNGNLGNNAAGPFLQNVDAWVEARPPLIDARLIVAFVDCFLTPLSVAR